MMRLTPHAHALIVPQSSGPRGAVDVSADDAAVERVDAIGLDVVVADLRVAPAALEDVGGDGRIRNRRARRRRSSAAGSPGRGPRAFGGRLSVTLIRGASAPLPIVPTISFFGPVILRHHAR